MTALARALSRATQRLSITSDTPRLDAELLMAAAHGIGRDALLLRPPAGEVPERFAEMVERRAGGEPIAYITGHRAFWTIDLEVGPGVLIPRPDSETLLVAAVEHFGRAAPARILDLGTGPGTLILAALDQWPVSAGVAIDRSTDALVYARRNAARLGLADRVTFRAGDWASGLDGRFDLIVCNPPYVAEDAKLGAGVREHEPSEALFAGPDGLDEYRRLLPDLPRLMNDGALAAVEIGTDQAGSVGDIARNAGFAVRVADDLGNRPRALLLTRRG